MRPVVRFFARGSPASLEGFAVPRMLDELLDTVGPLAQKNGNTLTVWDGKGGRSNITIRNVFQSNGVIHVVDGVLLPG